jgi:ATP-binding cassette subfamily G (WHITE) protein 2 (PDR)
MSVPSAPAFGSNAAGFHNGQPGTEIGNTTAFESRAEQPYDGRDQYTDKENEQARMDDMAQLARRVSRASTRPEWEDNDPATAFLRPKPDSNLDPNSSRFSYKAWAKALLNIRDPVENPARSSGLAFRNLSVHGFGSATDYQKTLFNAPLEALTVAKGLLGMRKDQKIQILRDFDGLLHSGEMLVVLGPPGSGCSTLLKTITGETAGINVSKESYLNYKGISPKQMHTHFKGEAIYTAEVDGACFDADLFVKVLT